MKRNITALLVAALMCIGTSALAADYDADNNAVSVDASGYQTVIITKDGDTTDNGIVYVNQTDSGTFSAAASFLIKADPAEGNYTVTLGGKDGEGAKTYKFSIIKAVEPEPQDEKADDVYEQKNADGSYDIGFGWHGVEMSGMKSVVLVLGDKAYAHELPTNFTDASAVVAVKITGITAGSFNTVNSAYLSSKSVEELKTN